MTKDQVITGLTYFYETYIPDEMHNLPNDIDALNSRVRHGSSVEETYQFLIESAMYTAAISVDAFPELPVSLHYAWHSDEYVTDLSASAIVDFLYPDASSVTRAALIEAASNGVSNIGLVQGLVDTLQQNPQPSVTDVLEAVPEPLAPPEPVPNGFDVTDYQLDFLTGIYVSAFNRAPEHEGLKYWAGSLKEKLDGGLSEQDAFKAIAGDIYWAGEQNAEHGTALSNANYITYIYQTVLNRAPDTDGHTHWIRELDSGTSPRSEFIAVFLTSALQAAGDSNYVSARIDIGKFVGLKTMSGPDVPMPDLVATLQGVHDMATASAAKSELIEWQQEIMFGPQTSAFSTFDESDLMPMASVAFNDSPYALPAIESAGVELIGHAETQEFDLGLV